MEKNPVSAIHFRTKLLTAACQMQNALNLVDLGQFYYKPLKDANGTIVISCVNAIKVSNIFSVDERITFEISQTKDKKSKFS